MTNDGVWTYTYDAEGNQATKSDGSGNTWTYGYDLQNRLTSAVETNGAATLARATYVYDALGKRLEADDYTSSGGTTTVTRFAYDGANVLADLNGSNGLLMWRVYGDRTDQVVARESAAGVVAGYLTDRLGSVRNLVDAGGSLLDTIAYDGFGNRTSESSPANGDRYGFTARELDSVTGLGYHRGRWYDPKTGRWTSQDPLGFDAGDGNLYRYVGNAPANATDPSGLDPDMWVEINLQRRQRELPPPPAVPREVNVDVVVLPEADVKGITIYVKFLGFSGRSEIAEEDTISRALIRAYKAVTRAWHELETYWDKLNEVQLGGGPLQPAREPSAIPQTKIEVQLARWFKGGMGLTRKEVNTVRLTLRKMYRGFGQTNRYNRLKIEDLRKRSGEESGYYGLQIAGGIGLGSAF
jgi:RHS repeat-associated protein